MRAAGELDFDLAASVDPDESPSLVDAGVTSFEAVTLSADESRALWPYAIAAGGAVLAVFVIGRRRLVPTPQGPWPL